MRILFCGSTYLNRELGASKVLIELADEMELLGWQCTLVSPRDVAPGANVNGEYGSHLRRYLIENASKFDVVEYDHNHLPFPRRDFPERTLFVARSVLLWRHFCSISLPREKSFNGRLRSLVYAMNDAKKREREARSARLTVTEADLINVANYDDRDALAESGISQENVTVIPYGMSRADRQIFDSISSQPPSVPKVAFVGTFDNRKGATDFPRIVQAVCEAMPGASFRLLGTGRDKRTVLASFPRRLRSVIEVVPSYAAPELPGLLAPCSVGVFPSYIEGFGFGVLEMLAASIPVVAYNSPGPPMMLPAEHLASRGDWRALSDKVIALLNDKSRLTHARLWAKERSKQFCWESVAKQTSEVYVEHWRRRQVESSSSLACSISGS
jgi:glycosyltransferase involved in cell wall biosynthesis